MEDNDVSGSKRISDVNILRSHQFREDAGPLAHPVRPESYVEINNFYTLTVYNKGAEVIRMLVARPCSDAMDSEGNGPLLFTPRRTGRHNR